MAGKAGQEPISAGPKGSARVASVLTKLKTTGAVPGYAPDQIGAQAHKPDEPGVLWVDVDHILDSPYQHQEQIDEAEFQALVESIQKEGFLAALNVNEDPQRAGYYILTAGGHQRRNAAKIAGKTKIPVFVEPTLDPIRLAFRAAKENAVQVNRSPVNLGFLFLQIQDEFDLTQEEIAAELGKDRNFVKTCITAAKSDPDIQELLAKKPDSLRAMTYLRRLDSLEDRAPIIARLIVGETTTEGVKAEVEEILLQRKTAAETSVHSMADEHANPATNGQEHGEQTTQDMAGQGTYGSNPEDRSDSSSGGEQGGPPRLALPQRAPLRGHTLPDEHARSTTVVAPSRITEEDPRVYERLGKLRDIRTRLEAYQRLRGQQPPAPMEQDALEQLDTMIKVLKGA